MTKYPIPFRKPLPILLSACLLTTLLTACNNNDEEDRKTSPLSQNSPLIGEPEIAAGTKTVATHYAKLGPLQNAVVAVYDPMDQGIALAKGTTNSDGSFNLTFIKALPELRPLILRVENGIDTDPDDNPATANTPIANKGSLHAIVFAEDLLATTSVIVSPVTEIVYQRLQSMIGILSPSELRQKLNDISSQLLSADITGNSITDYHDILAFDPSKSEMHNKLIVPFTKYHQQLSSGKSFIEALRNGDDNATELSSELLGASAPNIELPETNVADNVKLDISVSGAGTLESALFKTGKRRNSEGIYNIAVPRSLKESYQLTVKPDTGYKVVSWVGCSSISTDRLHCLVKPDQSKSVYAVLASEPVFRPEVKGHFKVPMESDVIISDSAGIMTISTRNADMGAGLATLPVGTVMSLPYLPHPLVGVTEIVSVVRNTSGTEVRFKFVDKQLTDVLSRATFYSTPEFKPSIGLDDVISVTMISDKTILKDPKVSPINDNFGSSPLQGGTTTGITPKYKDKSGSNHVSSRAWELVVHKDRCVLYGDDTPPTTRPTVPSDPKNDTLWTSALRAAEDSCDNKTLIYKPYADYIRDFNLTSTSLKEATNANHARFANMTYMQHMDKKALAKTPLYLISGTKKDGETMRTAAAWTWAQGVGPVLKVRKNVFLARKEDGRSGFDVISFDSKHRPKGNLYNVADFSCTKGQKCKLSDARLPNMPVSRQTTNNPWYFGPSDPVPSPYKHAVDTGNLYNLLGSDGLSMDFPFKRFSWLSAGVNAKLGFGMSVEYSFDYNILDFYAAFKLIPEVALEPRLEVNLKAGKNSSDWKAKGTEKPKLELTLMRINIGYAVLGPVASILRPELTLNAGIEFGGEAKIYAAYTRGMKAKMGVDAYYNKDLVWDGCCWPETRTDKRLDFPRSFDTYKSVFEFGAEGQLYVEPYLEFRMEGSVTGVGENLANVALRGFLNANAGFEAGVAINAVNKSGDEVNADIDRIGTEYKVKVLQAQLYDAAHAQFNCSNLSEGSWDHTICIAKSHAFAQQYDTESKATTALQAYNKSFNTASEEQINTQKEKIHSLYDKNYGGDFVDKVIDGQYTKSTAVSCKLGLKFGLDAGIRATAGINTKNINWVGDWIGEEMTLTLFEQRWPVKLKFIDDWNEKLAVCTAPDEPEPDDTAEEGTASINWKTNPTNNGEYALIECGTFSECKIQAAQAGAQLTSITSAAENQWIADNFVPSTSKNNGAWIGLNDVQQEGNYTWESDEAFSYSNWNGGEPNNVNEEDVVSMIRGGKWNDNALDDTSITRAVIEKVKDGIDWKTNPDNGNGYALVDCGTWQQCDTKARSVGARLVSISSASENQWLANTFNKTAWIGLNDIDSEGNYKWVSGETVGYTNWNSGEPNNAGNEDVVAIVGNGKWNDDSINNTSVGRAMFERLQPNWKFNSANDHSYAILECGSWPACQAQAKILGANLVTINNQAEQEWLHSNFNSTTKYWIGLTDKDQEGQWKWISGESPSFTNWNSGEPNDVNDEDYAEIVENGKWNDAQLGNTTVTKAVIEK